MTNITRRAALVGALASSASLAVPMAASLGGSKALAAITMAETADRPPMTLPELAAAMSDLLKASGRIRSVTVTAEWSRIGFQPATPASVPELMRQLSEALHAYGSGSDQFRAIVEPSGRYWLQAVDLPIPAVRHA